MDEINQRIIAQLVEHALAKVGVASSLPAEVLSGGESRFSLKKSTSKFEVLFSIFTKYFKDMDSENYFVYVLSSMVTNKFYVGMSAAPQQRLKQHNAGQSKFTKSFRPWELVYTEFAGSREDARKLEKYYKTGAGRSRWMKLIKES